MFHYEKDVAESELELTWVMEWNKDEFLNRENTLRQNGLKDGISSLFDLFQIIIHAACYIEHKGEGSWWPRVR